MLTDVLSIDILSIDGFFNVMTVVIIGIVTGIVVNGLVDMNANVLGDVTITSEFFMPFIYRYEESVLICLTPCIRWPVTLLDCS